MPLDPDIAVINRALARIGGGAISSRAEETKLAGKVVAIYDDLVEAAHTAWQWNWARRTRKLDRVEDDVESGYRFAYGFPADALGQPVALFTSPRDPNRSLREFRVEGRTVYCDAEALWGCFILRIAPDLWPPLFRTAVTMWLAGELCIPVSHDKDLAQQLTTGAIGTPSENLRGGMMGRAIGVDHATGGARASLTADDPLTGAHYTGGPWHGGW